MTNANEVKKALGMCYKQGLTSECVGCEYRENSSGCIDALMEDAFALINCLEDKQATSKWIPVTERLPKHGEIVLCYLKFEEARILQWDNVAAWWLGYGSGDDWRKMDVTHWMPLPEPPKGDE